jgi:hypothetical protein
VSSWFIYSIAFSCLWAQRHDNTLHDILLFLNCQSFQNLIHRFPHWAIQKRGETWLLSLLNKYLLGIYHMFGTIQTIKSIHVKWSTRSTGACFLVVKREETNNNFIKNSILEVASTIKIHKLSYIIVLGKAY